MKKSKGQTVDLLYTNKKEINKKSKNTTKKKKGKTKKVQNDNNERINLDNEIIIGLTPKKEETEKTKKNKKAEKQKTNNVGAAISRPQKRKKTNSKKQTSKKKNENTKANTKKINTKKKRKNKIIKWILIIILLATAVILFMMSSIFNIKEIVVVNNSKVSSQEIINLSQLIPGINMYKITNKTIKNNIKSNAYVEDVSIKRNINGTVTLDVKERRATYMLKFANAYVYINNQGYMIEISEEPLELPIITGFLTSNEEMKAGNRLNVDDLNKLDDVIKIMEVSKNTPLANIITEIDISNSMDYKLTVASEKKTVTIGDMTNLNIKLQMAGKVFSAEKDRTGEIYFQDDGKKAIFKEEVSR